MIFTTWLYGLFLMVAVVTFWSSPQRWRPWVLIALGMAFYANYYPPHLPLVLSMTALVYAAGRRGGVAIAAAIVVSLGALAYYKYTGFLAEMLRLVGWGGAGALVPPRTPLAISFFVFEFVHYLVERRRGTVGPGRPRDFLLFIVFFPSLISGPIKRWNDFEPQVGGQRRPKWPEMSLGIERILCGLAKKLLVADTVQRLMAPYWVDPLVHSTATLWCMTYGYAVQILFDFSGYTDIAIGSALLLGFHVPENFNYPYLQPNIARFWRSWHMSLTSWITDYVYIPLGGSRYGWWRAQRNRLIAMALCGLWHGAAGHFVLWGVYHGVLLDAYQGWRRIRVRLPLPADFGWAGRVVGTAVTFHAVCIGWVLFVLETQQALPVIARLLGIA